MDIVQNILSIAKKNGINDQKLCRILGTNSSKIYDWKKGKSRPSANDIAILAEYFNVTADYLVGRSEISSPALPEDSDDDFAVINRAALKASPDRRKKMVQMLKLGFEDLFEDTDES